METIKTENELKINSSEQENFEQMKKRIVDIISSLKESSLEITLYFEHLEEHKDKEFLWGFFYDVIDRLGFAISKVENFGDDILNDMLNDVDV